MTLKTNRDKLIVQSVLGAIAEPPMNPFSPYRISADGEPMVLPGTGGITYNARVGDSAIDIWADHVEPAVTIKHMDTDRGGVNNGGLQIMSCIGNVAKVVSGDAKDELGRVTGKHGGVFHVMIDFTAEQMDKMAIGDKIQIKSTGQGLALLDFPKIKLRNLDPNLFEAMDITGDTKKGSIRIPVTHLIPAAVMGSGLGANHTFGGDYDTQMFDPETVAKYSLDTLRFGDIVAIIDADHSYGRIYRQKAVSVGVVVHSRSVVSGHGPGVTTLFTSTEGLIELVVNADANLKDLFVKMGSING